MQFINYQWILANQYTLAVSNHLSFFGHFKLMLQFITQIDTLWRQERFFSPCKYLLNQQNTVFIVCIEYNATGDVREKKSSVSQCLVHRKGRIHICGKERIVLKTWIWVSTLPFTAYMTVVKLYVLSETWFPYM